MTRCAVVVPRTDPSRSPWRPLRPPKSLGGPLHRFPPILVRVPATSRVGSQLVAVWEPGSSQAPSGWIPNHPDYTPGRTVEVFRRRTNCKFD